MKHPGGTIAHQLNLVSQICYLVVHLNYNSTEATHPDALVRHPQVLSKLKRPFQYNILPLRETQHLGGHITYHIK